MQRRNRLNELINRRIESGWQIWCKHDRCHVAGRRSMAEILRLAIMAVAESGEVFLRIAPLERGKGFVFKDETVGGSIPGETKVASVAIYEFVEVMDYSQAHIYSAIMLVLSFAVLLGVYLFNERHNRRIGVQ